MNFDILIICAISLNCYSVVGNNLATIFSSLQLRKKILRTITWGLGQKNNMVTKTASSRKRKFSDYGVVFFIDRSLFQIIRPFFFRGRFDYLTTVPKGILFQSREITASRDVTMASSYLNKSHSFSALVKLNKCCNCNKF